VAYCCRASRRPAPRTGEINHESSGRHELRKVIWPNRKQMVTYTTVVLLFLAFMVAFIGGSTRQQGWSFR
jgi:preprotein translocase subunit SecE